MFRLKNQQIIFWLVGTILLLKLLLLPFAQTVNADAVSRIYAAISWKENPTIISHSFWGPLHFYVHGFGLMLWDNQIYTPKIITILFATFSLIPFYFFTKREFNTNGAIIATIFLSISPILFRNSFLALSETPYVFFLVLTLNFLSKGIRKKSTLYISLAGIAITIAGGFRYEAWIMIAIFTLLLFILKKWKYIFIFNSTALLFPIYWLISNWVTTGNPLYSFDGTYHWALDVMDNNNNITFENYLRRGWFFPFSWLIAIGIPTGYIILKTIINSFLKPINKRFLFYSIPFIIMFLFFLYNSFKGILLLQHRYIGTLVILSLPFIAHSFKELTSLNIKKATIFGALTVILSFVYNVSNIKPLPRLGDQTSTKIVELIKENTSHNSSLILDFIGWDHTYFIALQSKFPLKNISITEGAKNSKINFKDIEKKITAHNNGFVLLRKESELYQVLLPKISNHNNYSTILLFENEKIVVLKFNNSTSEVLHTQSLTL